MMDLQTASDRARNKWGWGAERVDVEDEDREDSARAETWLDISKGGGDGGLCAVSGGLGCFRNGRIGIGCFGGAGL